MRRLLRWLFGLDTLDDTLARPLLRRVERLEDDYSTLERRFNRLQGQVTRAWRDFDRVDDDDVLDEEPEVDEVAAMIERRRRDARG
jgi:hypothetical protein